MKQEKDELSVLFPFSEMELAGEKINLRPFAFGKWPEVITKAAGIVNIVLDTIRDKGAEAVDVSLAGDSFHVSPAAFDMLLNGQLHYHHGC